MSRSATKPGTVMVVDDVADIRTVLELTLRLDGFEVASFAEREAAVAAAEKLQPDILLMDFCMPGLSAQVFVQEMRRKLPALTVILMTGVVDPQRRAAELGIAHYLPKPFDYADMLQLLHDCIAPPPVLQSPVLITNARPSVIRTGAIAPA